MPVNRRKLEEKINQITQLLPEHLRKQQTTRNILRLLLMQKDYIELGNQANKKWFIIGYLHAIGIVDLLVIEDKWYIKVKEQYSIWDKVWEKLSKS